MRRVRPYIPLSVRVAVAERQARALGDLNDAPFALSWFEHYQLVAHEISLGERLRRLVDFLGNYLGDVLQLDHDPALILRKYKVDRRKPEAAWFTPNANDPDHLIYRPIGGHGQKTTGRKPGALKTATTLGSDIWLKTKFRRLEQPTKKRPAKIPARAKPWPKRPFAKRAPK